MLLILVGLGGGYVSLRTLVDMKSCDNIIIVLATLNIVVIILFVVHIARSRSYDAKSKRAENRPLAPDNNTISEM